MIGVTRLIGIALIGVGLTGSPALAQDHSQHQMQPGNSEAEPEDQAQDQAKSEVDHCAMGHLPPEQCPPKKSEPDVANSAATDPAAMDHAAMGHTVSKSVAGAAPETAVPARALEGPAHAADAIWGTAAMQPSREQLARENGAMTTGKVLIERLEMRIPTDGGEDGFLWDGQAWYGGDLNRFVLKSEGEGSFSGGVEDAEIQALFARAIGPFIDFQAGLRLDLEPETRTYAVIGIQGLAPYMVHFDGALFLSDRGDLTARIEAEYDQKLTQQWILQPRAELELAAQDIRRAGHRRRLHQSRAGLTFTL